MPQSNRPSPLAQNIANAPRRRDNDYPLWAGPCGSGDLGGITQSMLVRFLSCRERFRLKYVCGLEPPDKWDHKPGYGNMWHACEEGYARQMGESIPPSWLAHLLTHTHEQLLKYPHQRDEIAKWFNVCKVQFPEYVKYWREHPDAVGRTPVFQEQVFDERYKLPSGRVVRLRGKFDSLDEIDGGTWLQENKTKGDVDKLQIERQLKFDLQTMMYLVAVKLFMEAKTPFDPGPDEVPPVRGVRYNVVRRPLSGGKGSIRPHAAKSTKNKLVPAETDEEFYERLRRDYIAAEPDYWFFRVKVEVSERDIQVFRDTCLDPLLEVVCDWYDWTVDNDAFDWQEFPDRRMSASGLHYRTPFGVYSALEEGGSTEYDHYLETGGEAGLRRVEELFTELK